MALISQLFATIFQLHLYDLFVNYWSKFWMLGEILRLPKQDFKVFSYELSYRFNAIIHATYTSLMVTLYLTVWQYPYMVDNVIVYSMAYCVYDSFNVLMHKDKEKQVGNFLVHHALLFLSLAPNYGVNDPVRYQIMAIGLLTEWSTIFTNLSVVMHKSKLNDNAFFKLNGVLTVLTFFIFRIAMFPYIIYCTTFYSYFYTIAALAFYGLNCYWFRKLIAIYQDASTNQVRTHTRTRGRSPSRSNSLTYSSTTFSSEKNDETGTGVTDEKNK